MDGNNPLSELLNAIKDLCIENEVLKLMVQENWATIQELSWEDALRKNCNDKEVRLRSQSTKLGILPDQMQDVLVPCGSILREMTEAIEQTRAETDLRIQSAKEADAMIPVAPEVTNRS